MGQIQLASSHPVRNESTMVSTYASGLWEVLWRALAVLRHPAVLGQESGRTYFARPEVLRPAGCQMVCLRSQRRLCWSPYFATLRLFRSRENACTIHDIAATSKAVGKSMPELLRSCDARPLPLDPRSRSIKVRALSGFGRCRSCAVVSVPATFV